MKVGFIKRAQPVFNQEGGKAPGGAGGAQHRQPSSPAPLPEFITTTDESINGLELRIPNAIMHSARPSSSKYLLCLIFQLNFLKWLRNYALQRRSFRAYSTAPFLPAPTLRSVSFK